MRYLVRLTVVLAAMAVALGGVAAGVWQHHRAATAMLVGPVPAVVIAIDDIGYTDYSYRDEKGADHSDGSEQLSPTPSPGATIQIVYFADHPEDSVADPDSVSGHIGDLKFDRTLITLGCAALGIGAGGLILGTYAARRSAGLVETKPARPSGRA